MKRKGRYASGTTVPEERSRVALEQLLVRYGASGFAYAWKDGLAQVAFEYNGWPVQISVVLPRQGDEEFTLTETGKDRAPAVALKAWEQAKRQQWRSILLIVQAKFEAILAGAATFEDEFLAYLRLPDGLTVGDHMRPRLVGGLKGKSQLALPGLKDSK
jgi:hypothetical protein